MWPCTWPTVSTVALAVDETVIEFLPAMPRRKVGRVRVTLTVTVSVPLKLTAT
jgi:hypothetical protein